MYYSYLGYTYLFVGTLKSEICPVKIKFPNKPVVFNNFCFISQIFTTKLIKEKRKLLFFMKNINVIVSCVLINFFKVLTHFF